jgi:hypothetical protein
LRYGYKPHKFNVAPKEERTFYGEYRGRKQEIVFDSKKELEFFYLLWRMEVTGEIQGLQIKEKFRLGVDNRHYESDFTFFWKGKFYALDVKGFKTETFKLKWGLIKSKYPTVNFVLDDEAPMFTIEGRKRGM